MVDEKIIKFFEGVLSKTKEGKIPWEPTAQESNFIAAVGGQFTLSISAPAEDASALKPPAFYRALDKYVLTLRDMHGMITTITTFMTTIIMVFTMRAMSGYIILPHEYGIGPMHRL